MNSAIQDKRIIGLQPWLPGSWGQLTSWNEPIRAERLAAVRIGTAAVLLADISCLYLPQLTDFYGGGSLGSPEVFAGWNAYGLRWSLLAGVSDQSIIFAAMSVWILAAVCLLLGIFPRIAAGVAWALAISFHNANPYLHNSGDVVRQILLFYLMISPCGAAWSLASWRERRSRGDWRRAFIYPWPIRLLLIQMMAIYLVNGAYKCMGADWRDGEIMHRVLANLFWTRMSYEQLPLFPGAIALMTWATLVWELGFPVLVMIPRLRAATLWIGVAFHIGTGILLTVGAFPFYMLCLYLPFVPWERWLDRPAATGSFVPRHSAINLQTPGVNAAG